MDNINLSVVRETFGKIVYSHKTHEKAADICITKNKWFKRINVLLITLTSGSALGSILKGDYYLISTSILSTVTLFFVIYQLSLNLEQEAQNHKRTAKKLWLMREKYQNFIADIINGRHQINQIANMRNELLSELNKIIEDTPQTDSKAYYKARKALKIEEEMTFSKSEIDSFLPEELRINRS